MYQKARIFFINLENDIQCQLNASESHLISTYYPSGNIETKTTYNNGIQYTHIHLSEDGDVIDSGV
jgi:antitoxin component YwqK of YwqJK toxin-antitoxin module